MASRVKGRPYRNLLDVFPLGTPLADQVRDLGLDDRVAFDGKVSQAELERAYREASVVVVPSLFEGFGLPAIEGLAVGTPVVATRAGVLPEVIAAAATGRLVDPGDGAALAKGVGEVLDDWKGEHRCALAARAHIEAAFAWPVIAERTARIYVDLVRP